MFGLEAIDIVLNRWAGILFGHRLDKPVVRVLREGRGTPMSAAVIARVLSVERCVVVECLHRMELRNRVRRVDRNPNGERLWLSGH